MGGGPRVRPATGGMDHPMNYVAMHAALNASFGDQLPETKMGYIESHSHNALRHVHIFLQGRARWDMVRAAEDHYLEHGRPRA